MSKISSTISATTLQFNNSPVSFEIVVKNLSNDYAAFKISLTAAGADPNIKDTWYSLDPISSTLIPPGDRTKFDITILAAPVLGIDLINVEVKVASTELPDVNFHILKLLVSPGVERLRVYLPVKSFAIYPRKVLDIPVRVSNPNHHQVDTILKLTGLDSRWLEKGTERRLLIGAGKEEEINFTCQPPIVKHTPCGIYPFTVQANVNDGEWGKTSGDIKILPIGTVFFSVTPEYNTLPSKPSWRPQLKNEPATYQLELKNASNVDQNQIDISVENKQDKQCACQVIPPYGTAKVGETEHLRLEVRKKRPWWGLKRKYPLKITPSLSDSRLNTTNPSYQNVELSVYPLLPLWLQLGLGALATAFLIWLLSLLSAGHSKRVNSVTFSSSNINPILSASTDGTVRQWKASPDNLVCRWFKLQKFCLQHQGILFPSKTKGSLGGINVIKLRTDNNLSGRFAYLGFDSGRGSKLDLQSQSGQLETIIDEKDGESGTNNRILDVTFDPDSQKVFWGRGTKLLESNANNKSKRELIDREYAIYVLTLSPDNKSIVAGGQRNKIFRVELDKRSKAQELNLHLLKNKDADRITGLKFTENNILISTDNRGLIKIWDLNQCQGASCKLLYSNEEEKGSGINAIALTKYDKEYYLATADNEGKIKLWSFTEDFETIKLRMIDEVAQYPQKIISIDLIHQPSSSFNRFLILSGSEDKQVRLDVYNVKQ